jgi:hypothetical protein
MQRLRGFFFTPSGQQRLLLPALLIVVVTFAVGLGALRAVQQAVPDEARAAALARSGKFALAEQVYVRLLREKPSVTTAIALIENHQRAEVVTRLRSLTGKGAPGAGLGDDGTMHPEDAVMTDEALDELLEKTLPADVALVTRFWRAVDKGAVPSGLRDAILRAQRRSLPSPGTTTRSRATRFTSTTSTRPRCASSARASPSLRVARTSTARFSSGWRQTPGNTSVSACKMHAFRRRPHR